MRPQLQAIISEFEDNALRLHRLVQATPAGRLVQRPSPDRWSAAECLVHLNLTTVAYRPLVEPALEEARRLAKTNRRRDDSRPYRRGLVGSLVWWAVSKPGRLRAKTTAPFVPGKLPPLDAILSEFDRLQDEQVGWVRAGDGLPLDAVKLVSPFSSRVRYNLFMTMSILARHQQRHVIQAEQAVLEQGGLP